jgi:hypothetical protein
MYLNSVNQLIVVMVKCGVLFEVRTGFLNNIETSFVFKGLMHITINHTAQLKIAVIQLKPLKPLKTSINC